jgi:hypothetical protein
MSDTWKAELDRFQQMNLIDRLIWLSRLSFFISMYARGTYAVGSDEVDNSIALRKFNELLHRVADQQWSIARGKLERRPDEQFFELLALESRNLGISEMLLKSLS